MADENVDFWAPHLFRAISRLENRFCWQILVSARSTTLPTLDSNRLLGAGCFGCRVRHVQSLINLQPDFFFVDGKKSPNPRNVKTKNLYFEPKMRDNLRLRKRRVYTEEWCYKLTDRRDRFLILSTLIWLSTFLV